MQPNERLEIIVVEPIQLPMSQQTVKQQTDRIADHSQQNHETSCHGSKEARNGKLVRPSADSLWNDLAEEQHRAYTRYDSGV